MTGGRIPQQFIDDLLARTDIVEIIDGRLPLRKAGREFSACCPFHKEKTPSFFVNREKQFYHCFGCGAHGSAIGFLMEFDGMPFPDAIEDLARRQGLEVPREGDSAGTGADQALQPIYDVLEEAAAYYHRQLRQHPQARIAIDYLKGRGVHGEIAGRFNVGFAPPGWNNIQVGLDAAGARHALLLQAGLTTDKGVGDGYDRLRNRIVFPIRDQRGRVIGFGGRAIGDDKPKYLNSPETPVFHKGRELYGLYEARQANRKLDHILVVEGYMDVISLAQAGITNVVATLGTATTRDHLSKLWRQVSTLIFCFDGDRAGRQAAWRALETALPEMADGRQIRFMFLPEGEDPDTMIKQGVAGFQAQIETAIPFSEFLFEIMLKQADIRSIEGRAKLVELTRPLIARIPTGVFRHMVLSRLADLAQISVQQLEQPGEISVAEARPQRKRVISGKEKTKPSLIRRALQLLLADPRLALLEIPLGVFKNLKNPRYVLLLEMIEAIRLQPGLSTGMLLERRRESQEGDYLAKVLSLEMPPQELWESEFLACMHKLANQVREQGLDEAFEHIDRFREMDATEKTALWQRIKEHKTH